MYPESEVAERADEKETMQAAGGGTRLFQRFTLQRILGRGEMGLVYLARDDRLDRLVALKLIPEAVRLDPQAIEALKRETQRSQPLLHPNIARIFGFIEGDECAAIEMEFIDGVSLSRLRGQKRANCFAVSEIAPWVASLCDALAYAHDSMQVIHRHLKPSNLMVNARNALKLTDFGIDGPQRRSMNPSYMSPQHLAGARPSPSDDIYSLGATLYELLSSKPPFYEGDVPSQVRSTVAPWIAERREQLGIAGEAVPKHWEETIAACLAKNPADRPPSVVEIARRLRLGGTIRLAVEEEELNTRTLSRSLLQARVVGAAAGIVALIAAIVLMVRASHSNLSKVKQTVNAAIPNSFAAELFRPENNEPKVTLAPDPTPTIEPATVPIAAPKSASLQLSTTPAGARFAIFPGVVTGTAPPESPPLQVGAAPDSLDLPPGRYTVFFRNEGWPDERAEISLDAGENLPVAYVFPHGSATITSKPDGAEIFHGPRSLGRAPLTVDLPLGKQQLFARYQDRPERSQTVTVESDAPIVVAFQMSTPANSRRKPKHPPSAFDKIGQSLKNVFSRKPAKKP